MSLFGTLLSLLGFGLGVPIGLLLGYFFLIYSEPASELKEPRARPLTELDNNALLALMPDIPLWVKSPDYDRVDWLNKYLSLMWPYLDKAICNKVRERAKPIFKEYIGKYQIESIKFNQLTLGSLPPTISGIKIYETPQKELILETGIRWAGNSNITLELEWLSMKSTFQLIDLQIVAVPRISLKPLVPTFPCFANVVVSLMEKPHVDFGFKVIGGDIMAIPGIYHLTQEKIKEQVSNLYHWPKTLEVPILDVSSGAARKSVGILHVKIVRALNLSRADFLGKADPYVKISLDGKGHARKTSVLQKNLNPEWDENFKLTVKDPQTQVLHLNVYDWEAVKAHDKLGVQVVQLNQLTPNETSRFTLNLLKNLNPHDPQNRRSRGKIVVELRFDPFKEEDETFNRLSNGPSRDITSLAGSSRTRSYSGGLLSVTIEKAENVEGKCHTNPYAILFFQGEMKKTKRMKKNRDPRWDEEFEFTLESSPIDEKVRIEVMSKKRRAFFFYAMESLGHVEINLIDVLNNGQIHAEYNLIDSRNGTIQVELRWRSV